MKAICVFDKISNNGIEGIITFNQNSVNSPLEMNIQLQGFKPYTVHAIHIHEFGDLTEGCKSLGGHFNPTNKNHGHSEKGHAGDLFNNFKTSKFGTLNILYSTNKLSIYPSNKCIIGRSVVIHKFSDDYGLEGQKIGNKFVLYKDMNEDELSYICDVLGYTEVNTIDEMKQKLITESRTTGNASTRIGCAIVGISK